ncbi:MAG: hypothetical protein HZB59_04590 [Ignavibacteriales bacterium]|nr:hypothetical protein [Ignavibacteriales bacterium]
MVSLVNPKFIEGSNHDIVLKICASTTSVRIYCSILFVALYFFIGITNIYSQSDSTKTTADTLTQSISPPNPQSTSQSKSDELTEFHPTKSPMLAMGLSAIFPGSGQIYTENYWKVPIIWGVGGYWIYEWIHLNNKYKQFRSDYARTVNEQDLRLRDWYHDERDKFAWFLGALYMLNLVDAFAGAHLYDFNVSPDLTLDGRLVPKVAATIRLKF